MADGVRRSRYGVIRASYPALKSTVIKSWQHWFGILINIVYDTPIRGEIKIPHPDGKTECHIELIFIALDREDNVNKIQSLELTACHLNEAAEIPRGIHQMLKSRINRYPDMNIGGAIDPFIISDYNSVPTDHWLYLIAEEEQPPKHGFYHQPPAMLLCRQGESEIYDVAGNYYKINPDADNLFRYVEGDQDHPPTKVSIWDDTCGMWRVPNLSEDYYEDQVYGGQPDWINVMLLNNYGELRTGKPVTPMGTFQTFDEIVTDDCSIRKFCEDYLKPHIQNHYKDYNFELIVDPAVTIRSQNDAKAAGEIIKEAGLPFRPAKTNNPLKRREAVVYFLRKINGFKLGPKAPYLRKGFISEYKFEKKRLAVINVRGANNEMFKEKAEKNIYSHCHDGMQYGALEASEGRTSKKAKPRRRQTSRNTPADSDAGY
jgi:hypothetical protein